MKKYIKRMLALLLVAFMVIPVCNDYDVFASSPFNDMNGHWAETYVNDLYNSGVVIGDQNGNFRPDETITVADAATMLDKYYFGGFDRDTFPNYWNGHLEILDEMGVLSPSDYGSVTSNLTRLVAVLLVINSIENPNMTGMNVPTEFTDDGAIDPSYKRQVNFATKNGVLDGYEDGSFKPTRAITRAEFAKIMFVVKDDYALKEGAAVTPEVNAALELDVPGTVTWNYKQYEEGSYVYLDTVLDATGTTSNLPETYSFEALIGSRSAATKTQSNGYYNTNIKVYPNDIVSGQIKVTGKVTVEDETGLTDNATDTAYVATEIINEPPTAYFTNSSNNYVTLPMTLTNMSSDPEDDLETVLWNVYDSSNKLIFSHETDLTSGDVNYDYDDNYFSDITFGSNGGNLTFTKSDTYKVMITVTDNGGGYGAETDSYYKNIFVNTEPKPPVANFTMYEFGYPNESVPIKSTSTDPNGDIVTWEWTKPLINKEDGTAAAVSGNLSGENGGSLTFTKEGTYDVTLKVRDYTGLEDTITKEIKVIPPIAVARITKDGTFKENRKVTLHMRDSLSPRTDVIQTARNIWSITPLDGQDPNSIKIDTDTSNLEEKNIVFRETGRYKVYLKVFNNFGDANPTHPNIAASEITEIITITKDENPISDFTVGGSTPNFHDNPVDTTVNIGQSAYSIDQDLIAKYKYVVYRDMDEDGSFADEGVYGTYDVGNTDILVNFQQGISGMFKVDLEVIEEFGQPTIEKFVTLADRRKALKSKTFSVNWIPDISFALTEWAYTDDTLNLSTVLKDEEISKLKVKWSIRKANESDTVIMEPADINTKAEYTLNNNGGTIRFKDSGYYELIATVTDEIGQSYSYSKFIRIYPLPTAVITDAMSIGGTFNTKENRRYQIKGDTSYGNDYYGPELHSIDHTKDYWEIISLDGQNATNNIKVANGTGALASDVTSTTIYKKSNNELLEDVLFKLEGKYKVRYQVTNSYGKKSPFIEQIITVSKDTAPSISFDVVETSYRDVDDSKRAELTAYNIKSASLDGDNIINLNHRVRYRYDSDNDGLFIDEAWSAAQTIDFTNKRVSVKVPKVGKYEFELFVKDEFGQPTIDQFVSTSDRRESVTYKVITVDNQPPNVSFEIVPSNKVDVVFTVGMVSKEKILELDTKINNYIKVFLEANNADFVDARIETISTSGQNLSSAFTWKQDVSSSIGSITFQNNGSKIQMYGNTRNSGHNKIYTDNNTSDEISNQEMGFSYNLNFGDSFNGAGVLLNTNVENNKLYGYMLFISNNSIGYIYELKGVPTGPDYSYSSQITDSYYATLLDSASMGNSGQFKLQTTKSSLNIIKDGVNIKTVALPRHYGWGFGFFSDHYSHNCSRIGEFALENITMETTMGKSLDEVLKQPTWREDATRFVVNISDIKLPELEPTSEKYPVVLSRMFSDALYFAELGTSTNVTQAQEFIKDNDNKGTFIYNNPSMDTALQSLGTYILNTLRNKAHGVTQYVLLNEEVNYKTFYEDYEADPQITTINNWKYVHDYDWFTNDLGKVSYDSLWLTDAKTSFDKVGKYVTEYRTKDNPVGTDTRFDEYKKDSQMKNGPLSIFVHRRPIAQFTMSMQAISSITTAYNNQAAPGYSGGSRYAYWEPSYTAPSSSTITSVSFKTPYAYDDYWYSYIGMNIQAYKNGVWTIIKNYDSLTGTQDPISDTIDLSGQGYTAVKAYFVERDSSSSANLDTSTSYFNVGYTTLDTTGFNLTLTDTSYDLDHTNRADKGLVAREWYWKLVGEDTWHTGKLTTGVSTKDYLVKLRVRDMDGNNNLGVWSDDTIVLITNKAMPPIAQFSLSADVIAQGSTIGITDNSYDPNGHTIVQWEWKLYKDSVLIGTYTAANSQAAINTKIASSGIGNYKLTLQVRDSSGVWGDAKATSEIYTQTFRVVPVNHAPSANFDLVSNQSPAWTFPRTVAVAANKTAKFVSRPTGNFFHEELTRFNTTITDPNGADNLGFVYEWTLENYKVNNIASIGSTAPASVKSYTTATPFTNSFKAQGLDWGAYKITLKVTDKPKIPPYEVGSELSTYVTKTYYQIPDISINGSYTSPNTEIIVGDTLSLSATTNKEVTAVTAVLNGKTVSLTKDSTAGENVYWRGTLEVPSSITVSGSYTLQFQAKTNYGSNTGAITKEVYHDLSLNIIALRLMNFRITGIVNHTNVTFPYTKDMLVSNLINYKAGYYVTFQIDSKGNPDSVNADIYEGSTKKQDIALTKISSSGGTETWQGKFFTTARLAEGTEISIKIDCTKGATGYDYNVKEGWNGKSLRVSGSALSDGRINLIK